VDFFSAIKIINKKYELIRFLARKIYPSLLFPRTMNANILLRSLMCGPIESISGLNVAIESLHSYFKPANLLEGCLFLTVFLYKEQNLQRFSKDHSYKEPFLKKLIAPKLRYPIGILEEGHEKFLWSFDPEYALNALDFLYSCPIFPPSYYTICLLFFFIKYMYDGRSEKVRAENKRLYGFEPEKYIEL
jgi:hypothetical protein